MTLELFNTRELALGPERATVDMQAIVAQGERGEQGLPGNASAAWTASTAVTTGTVRQAPDGSWIKSTASRTTRATFDSTEQGFWAATLATAGTLEADALSATIGDQIATPGTPASDAVNTQVDAGVPPAVAVALTTDPGIGTTISTLLSNANLVQSTDARLPQTAAVEGVIFPDSSTTDAQGRQLEGYDAYGRKVFPGGHYDGATFTTNLPSDQFLAGHQDADGRVLENAIGLDGRIPRFVLDAIGTRIDVTKWPLVASLPVTIIHVRQDGSGDYTTIGAAVTAANTLLWANPYRILRVVVHEGTYNEVNISPSWGGSQTPLSGTPFSGRVEVAGVNVEKCRVVGYLPPNSTDATITATSTFNLYNSSQVSGLYISGQNVRYPIHHEGAGTNPDVCFDGDDLILEHLGNQEVIDWRNANGAPPGGPSDTASTVWPSWIPWGQGGASGQKTTLRRCTFRGRSTVFVHNDANFTNAQHNRFEMCRVVGTGTGSQVSVGDCGSGTADEMTWVDSEFDVTAIVQLDAPWVSTVAARQVADHRETRIVLGGCSPVGYQNTQRGKALKITSAGTAPAQSVTITASDNKLTFGTAHGKSVGDTITLAYLTNGAGLVGGRTYFVKTAPTTTTMTLAVTSGGTEIDVTTDGTGVAVLGVSTVRVSGTAADALFGVAGLPTYKDGGGGLPGYAYGYWDISGILVGSNSDQTVSNTIGKRLGDCSTVSKTLTITVDGGTPVNVAFSTNLTAVSNATIIGTINTALGSAATAAEYLVGPGEHYMSVLDKQIEKVNTGPAGIPRFAAVKYGANRRQVVLMAAGDAASLFVGFALNQAPPGAPCRVLTEGILRVDQLTGSVSSIAAGTAIGLSGVTGGQVVASATNQVATGIETDWAYFKGNR